MLSFFFFFKFSFRSCNLAQVNTILREQLDQAHLANGQLTRDLRRLTNELQQVREELTQKTKDWKKEERVSMKATRLCTKHDIISIDVQSLL